MQVAKDEKSGVIVNSYDAKVKAQKELVESLKAEWKLLWSERFNDKVRAEDVSVHDYASLNVEQGTIIHANRDYKAVAFKEILENHMISNPDRFIQPGTDEGGWSKFVKTKITSTRKKVKNYAPAPNTKQIQQPKKSGRGWLHTN